MQIIKANSTHLQDYNDLISACRIGLLRSGVHQWDGHYPDTEAIRHDISQGELFVAMVAGALVGGVTINQNEDPEYAKITWRYAAPALVIHRLCVSPPHQGLGFGSALMGFAENHARTAGFSSIRLDVYSDNTVAVNLYKRLGYSIAGQFSYPSRKHPFYGMEKFI